MSNSLFGCLLSMIFCLFRSHMSVPGHEFLGDIAESDSEDDGEEEEEDVDMDDASGAEAEVPTSKRQRRA